MPLGGVAAIERAMATGAGHRGGPGGAGGGRDRAGDRQAVTGRIDGIGGWWPARDGSAWLEVATPLGIARYPRDLAAPAVQLGGPALGELVALRGDRRLVRATPSTAVLLDAGGVRATSPLAALGAALGDTALIASSWNGSPGETVRRLALPAAAAPRAAAAGDAGGVTVAAELRDLPAVLPLDVAGAMAQADTGMPGVSAHAIDPADGAALYAIALESRRAGRGGARDLAARAGAGSASTAAAPARRSRSRWRATSSCAPRAAGRRRCGRPAATASRAGSGTATSMA